jgi:AcrR family transcriptional regulator
MMEKDFREKALEEARANPGSTKAKILKSSEELFARHGYDGTTTRDIAEAADVNIAQVHYHWGSKEELWNAVNYNVMSYALETLGVLFEPAVAESSFPVRFRAIVEIMFDFLAANPNVALLIKQSGSSPSVKPWAIDIGVPFVEAVQKYLEAETAFDFGPVDTRLALFCYIGAFEFFFTRASLLNSYFGELPDKMSPEFREKAIEALWTLAMRMGKVDLG